MLEAEELVEHVVAELDVALPRVVAEVVQVGILRVGRILCAFRNQPPCSGRSVKPVNFQAGLAHAECDEVLATRSEFTQEARWLLHIDQREVGVDIHVEPSMSVDQFATVVSGFASRRRPMNFSHQETKDDIL